MQSKSLPKVILLFCIFSIIHAGLDRKKFEILKKFVTSSVFREIKDVEVWNNNKFISLKPRFNDKDWSAGLEDTRHITDLVIKALCCVYSEKLNEFITAIELALNKCEDIFKSNEQKSKRGAVDSFNSCTLSIKNMFHSNKKIINEMYLKLINFSQVFHSKLDVNFYNAVVSINTFLFNDNVYGPISGGEGQTKIIVTRLIEKMRRLNVGVLKKLEGFSIVSCKQPIFDEDQTKNQIEKYCGDKMTPSDKLSCLGKYVSENNFLNLNIIPQLDLDVVAPISGFYEPQNLMLSNMLDLQLTIGNESTSIKKLLTVNWEGQESNIDQISLKLLNECRSESVIQHQLLMIDSIVSVVFHLTLYFFSNKDANHINASESLPKQKILKKLIKLNDFEFQEPLNSIFRGFMYTLKYHSGNEENEILSLVNMYLEKSNITSDKLHNFLRGKSRAELFNALFDFVNKIIDRKENIMISIDVVKTLTDYNAHESGYYQVIPTNNEKSSEKKLENYKDLNCDFALTLKKQFLLANKLLEICEIYTTEADKDQYVTNSLRHCFEYVGYYVQQMTNKAEYMFNEILNFDKAFNIKLHTNGKIINLFYSFMLLVNNKDFINMSNMHKYRSVDYVFSRIDILRRHHYLMINYSEKFSAAHCAIENARSGLLREIESEAEESCGNLNRYPKFQYFERLMFKNAAVDDSLLENRKILIALYGHKKLDGSNNRHIGFDSIENLRLETVLRQLDINEHRYVMKVLKALWLDGMRTLDSVQSMMKNYVEPRYLVKNHLVLVKSIVFITYEKMKGLLKEIEMSQIVSIEQDLQDKIKHWLEFFCSWNLPRNIYIRFKIIAELYHHLISNVGTLNKTSELIDVIEREQSRLRITKKSNVICIRNATRMLRDMSMENDLPWYLEKNINDSQEKWYDTENYFDYCTDSDTCSDTEYDENIPVSIQRLEIHYNKMINLSNSLHTIFSILDSFQVFHSMI